MRKLVSCLLFAAVFLQLSCGRGSNKDDGQKYIEGEQLISKALKHFYFESYSTQIQINKEYSQNLKTVDEMRMVGSFDGSRRKFMVQIKPGEKHKGRGILIEEDGDKITSAYTYTSGQKDVVALDMGQGGGGGGGQSNIDIVVGGLSFLDLRLLQGALPRKRVSKEGTVEINSRSCYELMVEYAEGYDYDRVQFFATQEELLPVLMKIFDQKGALLKEIVFDKYETVSGRQTVKVLIIKDKVYGYTSTFEFKDIHIGEPIEEKVFTVENLKKGWGT
jgi:hypothetical protein